MTEKCGGRKRWGVMKLFCEVVQACVRNRNRIDAQQLQEDGIKAGQAVNVEGTQRPARQWTTWTGDPAG